MDDFITRMQEKGVDFDLAVILSECCDEHGAPAPIIRHVDTV